MTRFFWWKSGGNQTTSAYHHPKHTISRCPQADCLCNPVKVTGISIVCLLGFFVLFSAVKDRPSYGIRTPDLKPRKRGVVDLDDIIDEIRKQNKTIGEYFTQPAEEVPRDKLLGGLLPAGLDEISCRSRYQSALYRKGQKHHPSSYLVSRLRKYEALHKRCAPGTEPYIRTLEYLKSGGQHTKSPGCKYVIWTPINGVGNRILSLASAFLYALLTNRVLLVDPRSKISDLFCEPFPEGTWLLPSNFPIIRKFKRFYRDSPQSFGNLIKNNSLGSSSSLSPPPYVYLHLVHDYDGYDKVFFCDRDQPAVHEVPWLILKSNIYFIPSLFYITSFQQEISNLFPDLGTVFHHLGRYLFHPSNFVWGLVTRYYNTNLARANEKIGIQIRVFDKEPDRFKRVLDQILACTVKENLLPQINETKPTVIQIQSGKLKTKAVMITSLTSEYFEAIKNMYWQRSNVTGEVIEVYQPSHEEREINDKQIQNIKAWAEMYLLSLTDKLVTSGGSTFGYVAHSLGGLKPWILYQPENHAAPDASCQRAVSMEPCMQAPPYFDCAKREYTGPGKLIPHVQHCEDKFWGLKFVDRDKDL